jgi:hypothetical protein
VGGGAALAPAAAELGAEGVEALVPEAAVALEPAVDLLQGRGVDGVQAPGAVGADGGEAVLAQDAQVLRHARLRDAELGLDDGTDGARGLLAVGEELEDAPADRVAEDVERVHGPIISVLTYISQA